MEALVDTGGLRAARRILLLHPDPERFARIPIPPGWELYGISRPDVARGVASSVCEAGAEAAMWLVDESYCRAFSHSFSPTIRNASSGHRRAEPALLIRDERATTGPGVLPVPFIGVIDAQGLADGLLPALLPHVMARWRAEQELASNREQLDFHRWHDPGTALPNPLLFREHLQRLVVRAKRLGVALALIQIDLVGFRRGVPRVDELRAIASALRRAGGVSNPAGRGDGCDFQLAISDLPLGPLAERRLAATMDRTMQLLRDAWPDAGGARMGVARLNSEVTAAESLEEAATDARREAWRSGRNWVDAETLDRRAVVFRADALYRQLTSQFLVPIVQPVVRLDDRSLASAEVLLRACDERGRLTPPACPLHALDDLELVQGIGERMRARASSWLQQVPRCPPLSVNLAPSELAENLPEVVRSIPASIRSRLTLELTEGALDGRPGQSQVIADLAATGISLSVDDFGTGHSALERLRCGHFRQLKLDRCFVTEITSSGVDRAIATSALELGRCLGLSVIAEGVETEAQRHVLAELGYRFAQGYLFARPMPFELFRARFLDHGTLPVD